MADGDKSFGMSVDVNTANVQFPWSTCFGLGTTFLQLRENQESHGGYVEGRYCTPNSSAGVHAGYRLATPPGSLIKDSGPNAAPGYGSIQSGIGLFSDWQFGEKPIPTLGWETYVKAVLPLKSINDQWALHLQVGFQFQMGLLKVDPQTGWQGTMDMRGMLFITLSFFGRPGYEPPQVIVPD